MKIKRSDAANLIEELRTLAANKGDERLVRLLKAANIPPLTACDGEAHTNGYIDHCGSCMPRWGWCGEPVKIT